MFEKLLLATSVWITPIGAVPSSAPVVAGVPVGLDTWVRPEVWAVPVYEARQSDPRQPLLYHPRAWSKVAAGEWKRAGNPPEVEAEILAGAEPGFPRAGNVYSSVSATEWKLPARFRGKDEAGKRELSFALGAAMTPAPGPDGHIVVAQPDGRVLEAYAAIRLSGGALVALSYAVTDPRGDGSGYENGQTASMLPSYLGVLDDAEANDGDIGHALAITLPARLLAPRAVAPAAAFDTGALTEKPPYSGALPMGARLALPVEAERLGLATPEGAAIARAARRYGFIVVDRGGEGISLRVRRNTASPNPRLRSFNTALADDLKRIFARLVLVPAAPTGEPR